METGHCWACGRHVRFNPTLVPRVNGEPLCARCVERVNVYLAEANERLVIIEEGTYPEDE